ncbi:DUF2931 domain-containing protein [Flavobacterium gelidilacus]|uniref:DUF2931 family protein n=1 Tax=Flavobacterium gelidilacus TaxID=206041 RepID=UPI0039EFEC01
MKHLLFILLITQLSSCQNKKAQKEKIEATQTKEMQTTQIEKFRWQDGSTCPIGYPIEVYRGGFESADGGYVDLQAGTDSGEGGWGDPGTGGMSDGIKAVPNRLHVQWVAYAEDCVYEIDTEIDYEKMVHYFKEGYQESLVFLNKNGKYEKETYTSIVVGYAPGGAVYIWLHGSGKQVEIGRYQGKKVIIPQEEIDKLDGFEKLMHQKNEAARIMNNPQIVPPEVREANKNKPIPFGLWDTYRQKYSWRPTFVIQNEGTMFITRMDMFNGEFEQLFDQSLIKNEFSKRAIPKKINFGWRDKTGQNYGGSIWFDEKEIFDAFTEIYKDNYQGETEIELRVNRTNTFVTAWLKGNGKEVGVNLKAKVEVFKSRKKY